MNGGTPRQRFMTFDGAYYGDTFGTMAVGARSLFSDVFQDLLFEVDFCPDPATWDGDKEMLDREAQCLAIIRANLASLVLLTKNEQICTQMEVWHRQHLMKLANKYPQLNEFRVTGIIAAIDINNHEQAGYLNNVGRKIGHHAIACDVLLSPLGNMLYLVPPYCITESELAWIYGQIDLVLDEVLDR